MKIDCREPFINCHDAHIHSTVNLNEINNIFACGYDIDCQSESYCDPSTLTPYAPSPIQTYDFPNGTCCDCLVETPGIIGCNDTTGLCQSIICDSSFAFSDVSCCGLDIGIGNGNEDGSQGTGGEFGSWDSNCVDVAEDICNPTPYPTRSPTTNPYTFQFTFAENDQKCQYSYDTQFTMCSHPAYDPSESISECITTAPTSAPSFSPTQPSSSPTNTPTLSPSSAPSMAPTNPTDNPSSAPTFSPTKSPSMSPTQPPSMTPSLSPSNAPSSAPTDPTSDPTLAPSSAPTMPPSNAPSYSPSKSPTPAPTTDPTLAPSNAPSLAPSLSPTESPTRAPITASDFDNEFEMIYRIYNLTQDGSLKIYLEDGMVESIMGIIKDSYVGIASRLPDKDFDLQPRQFHISNKAISRDENRIVMNTNVRYSNASIQTLIYFLSDRDDYIEMAQTQLRNNEAFGNPNILFEIEIVRIPPPISTFDYVFPGLLIMMALISLVAFAGFLYNKHKRSKTDNANWTAVIIYGLQIFDFISDINLALEMVIAFDGRFFDTDRMLLFISGWGSIMFITLPYVLNVYMTCTMKHFVSTNAAAVHYFEQRSSAFVMSVIVSGSVYPSLLLVSSRIFGLQYFNSGLTDYELRNLTGLKLYGNVFLENVPQLICQILYIIYLGKVSNNTRLSFFFIIYDHNGECFDTFCE